MVRLARTWRSRFFLADPSRRNQHSPPYLNAYSSEMAWREDYRRVSNGGQYLALATAAAHYPVSRQWKGYWQRRAA
jgi:hypothetical protein